MRGSSQPDSERTSTRQSGGLLPVLLGVVALLVGMYMSVGRLADNDWNPSVFVQFPAVDQEMLEYAEGLLGDVVTAPGMGHDGKFYFMQAMDPLFLNPGEHAAFLDRPRYRAQRMVYPTLAGVFGVLGATATAWSMIAMNLLGLGVGTWLTARLALALGTSPWFGLGFLLNPGILVASSINTADVFAMIFFVAAALTLLREKVGWAAVFLTLAALSRETMLLAAVGAALYLWLSRKSMPLVMAMPFVGAVAWWLFLRFRLAGIDDSVQDTAAAGAPFQGFVDAWSVWSENPDYLQDMLIGVVLALASLMIVVNAIRKRSVLGCMAAGFVLVAIVMIDEVWLRYFDSSRALAPVITAYILITPSKALPGLVATEPPPATEASDISGAGAAGVG